MQIGPRPKCTMCDRKHSARRELCWSCYRKVRDCRLIQVAAYGRTKWLVAVIATLTAEERAEVRVALEAVG
ncbi:MAG TPA: hypothetical protein VLT45_27885 [Kofleriaceae bacterium]|nr:hypothetical protein [Kofleriaceae bacterium]